MRLNKYIALATGMSRRAADAAIHDGRVTVNDISATIGQQVQDDDAVTIDKRVITLPVNTLMLMLNKPTGYVCSRDGQGSKTIYELLPSQYHHLKPVGRLDKDSSGLLLMTNDGDLAQRLTHPRFQKTKIYRVKLDHNLSEADFDAITKGVRLDDGASSLGLDFVNDGNTEWIVTIHEGRNRQIRRTFEALGYRVVRLHRVKFGPYQLSGLKLGAHMTVDKKIT